MRGHNFHLVYNLAAGPTEVISLYKSLRTVSIASMLLIVVRLTRLGSQHNLPRSPGPRNIAQRGGTYCPWALSMLTLRFAP